MKYVPGLHFCIDTEILMCSFILCTPSFPLELKAETRKNNDKVKWREITGKNRKWETDVYLFLKRREFPKQTRTPEFLSGEQRFSVLYQ
jgi:hypothetical protein